MQPLPILIGAGAAVVAHATFSLIQHGVDGFFLHRLGAAALVIGGVTLFVCIPMIAMMARVSRAHGSLLMCALPIVLGLLFVAGFSFVTKAIEFVEVSGVLVKAASKVTPEGWTYLIILGLEVAAVSAVGLASYWGAARLMRG
jgi:hypothetical protein